MAPPDWVENGSIYVLKPWVLWRLNNRLGRKIALYPMQSASFFQIDDPED